MNQVEELKKPEPWTPLCPTFGLSVSQGLGSAKYPQDAILDIFYMKTLINVK
jgi:hypothetical protein